MVSIDKWANRIIVAGWVLMASGGAVFFSVVFAGAGVVIFLAGAALCLLGGGISAFAALLGYLRSRRGLLILHPVVQERLRMLLSGLGGNGAWLVVKTGRSNYEVFDGTGKRRRLSVKPGRNGSGGRSPRRCLGPLCRALETRTPSSGLFARLEICQGPFCHRWAEEGCSAVAWTAFYLNARPAALAVGFHGSPGIAPENLELVRSVATEMAIAGESKAA